MPPAEVQEAGEFQALVTAVLGLCLSGQPLSVAALICFITLAGISVRDGILNVSHYISPMQFEGAHCDQKMTLHGSLERLSPVLSSVLCALCSVLCADGGAGHGLRFGTTAV